MFNSNKDMEVLTLDEKYKVINSFIKSLIEKGVIDIYFEEDLGFNFDKMFLVECETRIFDDYNFIKNLD